MLKSNKQGALVDIDPEIERTLLARRRQQRQQQEAESEPSMEDHTDNKPLKDYAAPSTKSLRSSIRKPPIEANNFELKPALLSMIQQHQFGGMPTEDPSLHLQIFLEFCETLKYNGATAEAIRLRLFPFSLRDRARAWLHSLPPDYIITWDQLEQKFLDKYFPPSKTANLRHQITNFFQQDRETLFEAWDRFKGLLQQCPHHGLERWLIIHTFYNGCSYASKVSLDNAAGGAIMNKTLEEAFDIIENVALNSHQWATERSNLARPQGKYEVSSLDLLAAKVDALTQKFESFNVSAVSNVSCEICDVAGHTALNCQVGQASNARVPVEQLDAIGNFNQRPNNPYSNTYNPGWRSHPNFSYRNNNPPPNPSGQATLGSSTSSFQPPQKSNLEVMMENFITHQTKQNDEFRQHMKDANRQYKETSDAICQLSGKIDNILSHNKMIDTQISQLAGASSRTQGRFAGNTEPNPAEHCNAIVLRSGRTLQGQENDRYESSQEPREFLEERGENSVKHTLPVPSGTGVFRPENSHSVPHGRAVSFDTAVPVQNPEGSVKHGRVFPHGRAVFTSEEPNAEKLTAEEDDLTVNAKGKAYKPSIPFPQRLVKAKLNEQFGKFLEMMKKLYVNIPFTDVLQQMPTYSKFLKDILSNKRSIEGHDTIALTEECSALIQNKVSPKLKDPGSFSIPCSLGGIHFDKAFCDLGASVNLIPLSVCKRLEFGDLKLTTMTLQLADRSIRYPLGILEDIPVKVGNFVIPADFVVLDMDEDPSIPIILGRPFLATVGAVIDVKNHKLSLTFGDEKIEFDLSNITKHPFVQNVCCRVDCSKEKLSTMAGCYDTTHLDKESSSTPSKGAKRGKPRWIYFPKNQGKSLGYHDPG